MPIYNETSKDEKIVRVLRRLQRDTPINAVNPGSIARALTEILIDELDRFERTLDFTMSNTLISKAQGRALDMIGELYNVTRKELSNTAKTGRVIGQFYFYLASPHNENIVIPEDTLVSTEATNPNETPYSYRVASTVTLPAGRLRVYAPLEPNDTNSTFTAGPNTLTSHNLTEPEGITLYCTNPKTIDAIVGYESDSEYRDRIIKAVRTTAGGTVQALRLTGLQVEGVREIIMRNTPYGLGTMEAVIVPDSVSISRRVLAAATAAMNPVRPAGSRLLAILPDYLTLTTDIHLVVDKGANADSGRIEDAAGRSVRRYLQTLLPGDKMVYAKLIEAVLDASDAIEDVVFRNLQISGTEILRQNYTPKKNEQIVPGSIQPKVIN